MIVAGGLRDGAREEDGCQLWVERLAMMMMGKEEEGDGGAGGISYK